MCIAPLHKKLPWLLAPHGEGSASTDEGVTDIGSRFHRAAAALGAPEKFCGNEATARRVERVFDGITVNTRNCPYQACTLPDTGAKNIHQQHREYTALLSELWGDLGWCQNGGTGCGWKILLRMILWQWVYSLH